MRFCKFRQKEVINILDGKSLGYISDLEIDPANGCICALIVPGPAGLRNLFQGQKYVVPWCNICKIGEDVILVEVDSSCLSSCK